MPQSVLFLCHGNVCRSPFAAALFAREAAARIPTPITVGSAGLISPGRASPPSAVAAAARRGIDLSRHQSRLLRRVQHATRIDRGHVGRSGAGGSARGRPLIRTLILGDLDPEPAGARTIGDPMGGPDELFDDSYDRIARCVRR